MLILLYTTGFVLLLYIILLYVYQYCWFKLPLLTSKGYNEKWPSLRITVIIPARNEEKNIAACLQSLAEQTYPASLLQIIVINDHSTDNTAQVVSNFPADNLLLINLADYISDPINSYKKKAIEIAVEKATGELIITTDADCTAPSKWIETIASLHLSVDSAFIAAPVKLVPPNQKKKKSLLFVFQALDFMALQGITAAAVHKGFHSMCNGANLAYTKRAFYAVDGFKGIDAIASGDDMLLMHKIYRKYPEDVFYLRSPDAIVSTQAAATWGAFLNQRIRWASKAEKYEDKRIAAVLMLVYALNVLLVLLFIGCLFDPDAWKILLHMLIVKTILEMSFMLLVAHFYNMLRLLIWFPFLQPLHILYTVIAGFFGKFGRYNWKGRKVR